MDESLGSGVTASDLLDRVLGFEKPNDWRAFGGRIARSKEHTQGQYSLGITPSSGRAILQSRRLPTPAIVGTEIGIDVAPKVAASASWKGELALQVNIPSQDVWGADLGARDLTELPSGAFSRVVFTVPEWLVGKLKQSYTDLSIELRLLAPKALGSQVLFDNLAFHSPAPPSTGTAAMLVDRRLYTQLEPEIDAYRDKAQTRRGFAIDLLVVDGIDDWSYKAVKDYVVSLKKANANLEGILVMGNVKLPSFFQSRADNADVRILARYLEDLDGVFQKNMADGSTEPNCSTGQNPCHVSGPISVPAHDLDYTAKGENPDPEIWAAFMPVGITDSTNSYTDFADQLRPYLQKVIRFYSTEVAHSGRFYYVSNDKGERMDVNWATFGPAAIDFYGKPGPNGETGMACIQGTTNLCYQRWPMETYPTYAAFEQAWSAVWVGEGWQQDSVFLSHMEANVYPIVEVNVHSNWEWSLINTAQAKSMNNGGLIVALDGCGVMALTQPGSPSHAEGAYASNNILLGFLYGASAAIAGSGDPFTRGHYGNHPTVWQRMQADGDYLGKAHLERMKVNYASSGNEWELRENGMEMLVGDPFIDLQ